MHTNFKTIAPRLDNRVSIIKLFHHFNLFIQAFLPSKYDHFSIRRQATLECSTSRMYAWCGMPTWTTRSTWAYRTSKWSPSESVTPSSGWPSCWKHRSRVVVMCSASVSIRRRNFRRQWNKYRTCTRWVSQFRGRAFLKWRHRGGGGGQPNWWPMVTYSWVVYDYEWRD